MPLIALVDDQENVLHALKVILAAHGWTDTKTYNEPRELLRDMLEGLRPAMVVTDFYMLGFNGVELLDTITMLYGDIPSIIVTGYPEGVQSVSKLNKKYPVLCKGDAGFFKDLLRHIDRTLGRRNAAKTAPETMKYC